MYQRNWKLVLEIKAWTFKLLYHAISESVSSNQNIDFIICQESFDIWIKDSTCAKNRIIFVVLDIEILLVSNSFYLIIIWLPLNVFHPGEPLHIVLLKYHKRISNQLGFDKLW
jgi:hypothetical protein